jgi:ADP-heptose:LPS heptosyltransferase
VIRAIHEAISGQLVVEAEGDRDDRFAFRHPVIRDAGLEEVLRLERRALHRRVAEALEQDGRRDDALSALAYHWEEAGDREGSGRTNVLIHPGARFPHKIWPAERFAAVGRGLESMGAAVHVLRGPGDVMDNSIDGFPVLENVPPGELLSMMKAYDLFIGNDSGPAHFAAASGCRVIVVCGPTDVVRWRPFTSSHRLFASSCPCGPGWTGPCRTPNNWCMMAVSVDEVLQGARELLSPSR